VGPIAVGDGGRVIQRTAAGWSTIEDSGIAGNGKSLNGAATTAEGRFIWMCGTSGTVGVYHATDDTFIDYSKPAGISNTWTDIVVSGGARSERVLLVNGSGQLLEGTRKDCDEMQWTQKSAPTGSALYAIENVQGSRYRVAGGSGTASESENSGGEWASIGIANFGKTLYDIDSTYLGTASAVGNAGYIADYDGENWTILQPGSKRIRGVSRTGSDGIAVGGNNAIYHRSSDGTWTRTESGVSATFMGVATTGEFDYPDVIVGSSGTVLERGEFTAEPADLTVHAGRQALDSYKVVVNGTASKGLLADSGDSVQTSSGQQSLVGDIDAPNGDLRDTLTYSGTIADLELPTGSGDGVRITANSRPVSIPRIAQSAWSEAESPTQKSLYSATASAVGPAAVGGGGKVLLRMSGSWDIIVSSGPANNGNTLRSIESTEDGGVIWFGGSSGALGRYDVNNGTLSDYTAPQNVSNTWTSMYVIGSSGSERIILGSGSGQILVGDKTDNGVQWADPITPASGSGITGIDFHSSTTGMFCDTNGAVYRTPDKGVSWQQIGIDSVGGTPLDIATSGPEQSMVACGSGYISHYNGAVWTDRKLGAGSRKAIMQLDDRTLVGGGNGVVHSDRLSGWDPMLDSGTTINGVVLFKGQNETAIAVGNSGKIYEQHLRSDLF
jgi:hypothetical protein